MVEERKARAVGINHVALEVGRNRDYGVQSIVASEVGVRIQPDP